ncbi:Chromate resistance protein ChrB [Nocardia terpenica]
MLCRDRDTDAARLESMFTAERGEEWAEFPADCAGFDAEIYKESAKSKFTMADYTVRVFHALHQM